MASFLELLKSRPDANAIMEFKATSYQEERLQHLLDKNKEMTLSISEQVEVESYLEANHHIAMFKIDAYDELNNDR